MADNMIELVASLNVDDSAEQINKVDIPLLQQKIEAIKIKCELDTDSISSIQSQLANIKINAPQIDLGVSGISQTVSDIQRSLSIPAKVDLSMNSTEIDRFIDKLTSLNVYGVNISDLQKRFENLNVAIESISPTFTTLEEGGEKALSSLSVKGKDSFGNLVSYIETYDAQSGEFVKSTTKVTENIGKIAQAQSKLKQEMSDVETQWAVQAEKLQQFIANAEKAGASSTVLAEDIANLQNKLVTKGDISAMKAFQDDFALATSKLQAFNAEVGKENAIANLQNRIKRLTSDVNYYAEANQRAVESTKKMSSGKTFAVEWNRIVSEMSKGADLTDRELQDLSADMAVFRKEAQAAGLAGESAFGKFLNSFKTMSSYITANMVFNFVKRQIGDMVSEVTAIDTAMTELRKVTEATNAEFEAFAKSAGQTGRELGASISDVINATATFARLGESLPDAEELGRVATLYQNVGDGIDIETASEDIVSTMKAFKIEAKDAITIVDKFNEVETCPFYILIERNRRHIFSNCWEILKSFSLLFSKRRKSEISKRIAYGEKKHIWFAKPYMS